jgi:hypothetical protein
MSQIYCGADKLKKNQRKGTIKECVEKKQIRLYGLKKVDEKMISYSKRKDILPDTREKLILKMSALRGTIRTNKGRYETTKNEATRPEYYKIWKDAEKELIKVSNKLKKMEKAKKK